jgi:hypothetical protein
MKINELEDALKPGEKRLFTPSNTKKGKTFTDFLTDCSDSIAAIKAADKFIYRGMSDSPLIFKGRSRDNRSPLDTTMRTTEGIDKILSATGFTALRTNSIFCSGDSHQAGMYGDYVYLIFPINGFSFTWSEKIHDFTNFVADNAINNYSDFSKATKAGRDFLDQKRKAGSSLSKIQNKIMAHKSMLDYTYAYSIDSMYSIFYGFIYDKSYDEETVKNRLNFLYTTSDKIMKATGTKLLNPTDKHTIEAYIKLISQEVKFTPQDVIDYTEYKHDNLGAAIKSGNELMIHGEYYAFRASAYQSRLREELLDGEKIITADDWKKGKKYAN